MLNTLKLARNTKTFAVIVVVTLLASFLVFNEPANAQPIDPQTREIKITPDGAIEDSNPTTPLQQAGNVYTLTGDVYGRIDIQKSGVTLDGAGYSFIRNGSKDFAVMVGGMDGLNQPSVNGVTVKNLKVAGFRYAVSLHGCSDVVSGVTVTGGDNYNGVGIWVGGNYHTIQDCTIVDNKGYGMLVNGNGTTISNNVFSNNGNCGITFYDTPGTLRNNVFNNNTGGPFHMEEMELSHAGQPFRVTSSSIDPSNTVDGKSVYYWVSEHDKTVPSNAGYVVLDSCTNIVVDGLSISRHPTLYPQPAYYAPAISLIRSSNIVVKSNHLENTGIWCSYSSQDITLIYNTVMGNGIDTRASNTTILMNTISVANGTGIILGGSQSKATVAKNILLDCEIGIKLESCGFSRILQNNISNCNTGIDIFSSNNNTINHNNLGNTQQVYEAHSALVWPMTQYYQSLDNVWDGNYWSTYTGLDVDGNGVGDSPYVVFENTTDYRPLMAPYDIAAEIPQVPDGAPPTPEPSASVLPTASPTSSPTPTATSAIDALPELTPITTILLVVVFVVVLVGVSLAVYAKRCRPYV